MYLKPTCVSMLYGVGALGPLSHLLVGFGPRHKRFSLGSSGKVVAV